MRRALLSLVLLVLPAAPGCAVLSEEHRPITRHLDERATPETAAGRVALAPVALPVGALTLAIDGLLLNPVRRLPDALDAARWAFEVESTGPLEVFVAPMRVVTFVSILVGAEVVLTCLPL